ncbi:hypothetical protein PG984_010562 [Apiospora sp. TS-2023a]
MQLYDDYSRSNQACDAFEGVVPNITVTTSVLYEDLANTIDGGEDGANAAQALVQCGANGGQLGVFFDAANPAYNTAEYTASGAEPRGMIIKLLRTSGSLFRNSSTGK